MGGAVQNIAHSSRFGILWERASLAGRRSTGRQVFRVLGTCGRQPKVTGAQTLGDDRSNRGFCFSSAASGKCCSADFADIFPFAAPQSLPMDSPCRQLSNHCFHPRVSTRGVHGAKGLWGGRSSAAIARGNRRVYEKPRCVATKRVCGDVFGGARRVAAACLPSGAHPPRATFPPSPHTPRREGSARICV